jgi:hypothetical protein
MLKMRIEIITSKNPMSWYSNKIGCFCDVCKLDSDYYLVSGSDFHLIDISDCKILKE